MKTRSALAGLALLAAGCATTLAPAPGANRLTERAAFAEKQGVRVVARAHAWYGIPASLPDELTPLLITVVNDSARPIRVEHENFVLSAGEGEGVAYAALEPSRIDRVVSETLVDPLYPAPGSPAFAGTFVWPHPAYWNTRAPVVRQVRLPTFDMLRQALPEGVLEPGGQATGFVYFERLHHGEYRVELQARFPAAATEQATRIDIPFRMS